MPEPLNLASFTELQADQQPKAPDKMIVQRRKQTATGPGRRVAARKPIQQQNNNQLQQMKPGSGKKQVQISGHCSDYCHALCNPFDAKPAGMPTFPALPTLKQKVYARGTAYTGSMGVGFVALRPDHAVVSDDASVWYTTASFAGTTFDFTTASTASSNSMFVTADLGPDGSSFRVIGSGLRVRYGGTELNRGGFKVCLVDPTHRTLSGRDEASLNAEVQTRRVNVTRQWTSLLYRPVLPNEVEFQSSFNTDTRPYIGVMMISPDNSINELFEWEAYTIVEYQGVNARGQTHTNPDPVGFAAVSAVVNQTNGVLTKPPAQAASEMHTAVGHYIANGISGVNDVVSSISGVIDTAASVASTASKAWTIFEDIFDIAAPVLALI
jgi:hypothetical protein